MAGLFEKLVRSFVSKVGEKLAECGWEAVTGNKENKDPKFSLQTLQRSLKSLSCKACDVKDQIKHGEQSGKMKRKRQVENWLEEVAEIESELGALQNEVQQEGFLGRFFGENRVLELNVRVCDLVEQSQHFGELLVPRENRGELLWTPRLTGEMFEKNVKVIWEWLVNDKVKSIGIYGMGGVGKTTLAKRINNQLLNENRRVYWVTVSQVFTTKKLQSDIAKVVDLDLSDKEDEDNRAARLNQALSKKEDFVLILDDVWRYIDLGKMGVPLGVEGCRLIVTTRSLQVCQSIAGEQKIEVKTLQNDESWILFRETLGERMAITSEVEEIAKSLAKECDGLPLGIKVLAESMKGVTDDHEWRNAYDEIRKSPMGLDGMKDIFQVLKYSFNRLDPEFDEKRRRNGYTKLQLCFLYCSLYPEDYEISKDKLVERFISEELVDTSECRQRQLNQGYAILSKLVNRCLLENSINACEETVKMHDLMRDMAIKIARESPKYMVFAGCALKKIPDEKEWTEDVDMISLMRNEIREIPPEMAPNCPKLTTLFLNDNPLYFLMPESFFAKMSGLRILDLSGTSIRSLPESLSDLESLNTLLLNYCRFLFSVPILGKLKALRVLDLSYTPIRRLPESLSDLESLDTLLLNYCEFLIYVPFLGKLKALRVLDLSYTAIRDMPKGMENLINLKILLFRGAKKLKLQPGGLPRNLQHLELPFQIEVPVRDIGSFKQLNRFRGRFKDVSDFNWFQSQTGGLISKFYYIVGKIPWRLVPASTLLSIDRCSLRRQGEDRVNISTPAEKIKRLQITNCKDLSSCLFDDFNLCSSSVIERLEIVACEGIESIWNINDQLMAETTKKVECVDLRVLPDLKGLVNWGEGGLGRLPCPPPQAAMIFSSLKQLEIFKCNKMKTLGLPLPCLHNIIWIKVSDCDEIEELIELDEDYEEISEPTRSLPSLKEFRVWNLPKLKSICKALIDCKSIELIGIWKCPRVKKLPLFLPASSYGQVINYSPPPALRKIYIRQELWESLEWDDIRHKYLLQPSVTFSYFTF